MTTSDAHDRGGEERWPYGTGLLFFHPGTTPAARWRRIVFTVVGLVATAALVWPVYSWVAVAEPRIFGLPLFFAWVVGALLVMLVNLVVLFRHDDEVAGDGADGGTGG